MKKIIFFLLVIMIFFTGLYENISYADTIKAVDLKKGDIVELGRFKNGNLRWRVANYEDGNPVLVSTYIVDFKPFSGQYPVDGRDFVDSAGKYQGDPYWARSALRDWLNSDETPVFYQATPPSYFRESGFLKDFTDTEKSAILSLAQPFESGPIKHDVTGRFHNNTNILLQDPDNNTGLYYLRYSDPILSRYDFSVDKVSILNNNNFTSADWDIIKPTIPQFIGQYLDAKGILSTNSIRNGHYIWGKGIYGKNSKGIYTAHVYRWDRWNETYHYGPGRLLAGDSYMLIWYYASSYYEGKNLGYQSMGSQIWYFSRGDSASNLANGNNIYIYPKIKPSTLENYGVMPTIILNKNTDLLLSDDGTYYTLNNGLTKFPTMKLNMPEKQYLSENSYFEMSGEVKSGDGNPVTLTYKVMDLLSSNVILEGSIGSGVNFSFDMSNEENMVYMDSSFAYDNNSFAVKFIMEDSMGRETEHDALVYIKNKNPYEYLIPTDIPSY